VTTTDVVRPKRGRQTAFDMLRSLGLIVVVVALTLVFVPNLIHPGKSSRYPSADYNDDVFGFRQVTGVQPLAPAGLSSGWYANGAWLTHKGRTAHLHIGWVTPNREYAALEEDVGLPPSAFIGSVLGARGSHSTGTTAIRGADWAERTSSRGERSISRTIGRLTVVITGSASAEQQAQLAAALH
jgi:hypothetical protein